MNEPWHIPFAEDLVAGLDQPRRVRVYDQWIPVKQKWWNNALTQRGLPGGPMQVTHRSELGPGISRRDLFDLAATIDSTEGALRLLWHTLAWGGGKKARLMIKRLDSVAAELEAASGALRVAAASASTSPAEAYGTLYPSGRTFIKYLGPAFFTKYLYFAGGGAATHPCAILDSVVAANLRSRGWDGLRSGGWSAVTYEQYCDLLACWAREASGRLTRPVTLDEAERWLFDG